MSTILQILTRQPLLVLCLLGSTAGCESARYVSKNADEGIIALPSDNERNRKKAERMMAAHFPDGYEIVHEYEEKIGSTTYGKKQTNTTPNAYLAGYVDGNQGANGKGRAVRPSYAETMLTRSKHTHSQSTTLDKTEWRIRYRRKRPATKPRGAETSIADIPSAAH